MSRSLSFQKGPAGEKLLAWHRGLKEHDRGGRARLRRASSPAEVAYEPAYHHLLRALVPDLEPDDVPLRAALAAVAGLAARVEEHVASAKLATQMGTPADKRAGSPPVSEPRFRRLLTLDDPAERFSHLARIVDLLGRRVNLLSLADAAYRWDATTRQQWAYDYYLAAPDRTANS